METTTPKTFEPITRVIRAVSPNKAVSVAIKLDKSYLKNFTFCTYTEPLAENTYLVVLAHNLTDIAKATEEFFTARSDYKRRT